jgi:hypothetical protein
MLSVSDKNGVVLFFQLSHQFSLFPLVCSGSAQNSEFEEPGGLAPAQHHSQARLGIAQKVGPIFGKSSRSWNHLCEFGKSNFPAFLGGQCCKHFYKGRCQGTLTEGEGSVQLTSLLRLHVLLQRLIRISI